MIFQIRRKQLRRERASTLLSNFLFFARLCAPRLPCRRLIRFRCGLGAAGASGGLMRAKAGGPSPEPQSRRVCETRALSWASGRSPQGIETRASGRKSCAGSIGSGDEPGFGAASITAIEGRGSRSRMHFESESKRETQPADLGAGQAGPAFSGSRGRSLGPDVGEKGKERERKGKKAKESEGGGQDAFPSSETALKLGLGAGFD